MASWILNSTRVAGGRPSELPEQARVLLAAGLWGIPPTSQAREKLQPGDRLLVYVGAPHRILLGIASVADGWHRWSADEAARVPPTVAFETGIALAGAHAWEHPLPLHAAWPGRQGAWTNPRPVWHGAAARLLDADFDALVAAAAAPRSPGEPAPAATTKQRHAAGISPRRRAVASARAGSEARAQRPARPATAAAPTGDRTPRPSDALFEAARELRGFRTAGAPPPSPRQLTEASTRAFLVDRQLAALGFRDFEDVDHGAAVPSGDVPDYVLRAAGAPVMAVEARRLGHPLGTREASQLVKYCSVLGLRWGLLTDGRLLRVYDAPVTGVAPDQRLVVELDLDDWRDRDDFDRRIWPRAAMLTKTALHEGGALERWAARERIRALLADRGSRTIRALQRELRSEKVLLDAETVVALAGELIA